MVGLVLAALVGAWFRNREPEVIDEAAPGNAQWPPLTPLPGDDTPAAPQDAPAGPPTAEPPWIAPNDDGSCPLSHPVKVKVSSGIHHVPVGFSYERTRADRCYASPEQAEADGFRAAKR